MKKIFITLATLAACSITYAGGIATNTNQHAAYQRNFAREATTDADAAYSNPAGLGFIEDGLHISFSAQTAFQERNIKSNYGGLLNKEFKGEAIAPFIPSLQAVYKKNDWAFYFNGAVSGGGGKATYDNGLPMFESQVAQFPAMLSNLDSKNGLGGMLKTTKYSVECEMEGAQYIAGFTLGATKKIFENFSASVGIRMSYAINKYEGEIENIKIDPAIAKGNMISPQYLANMISNSKDFSQYSDLANGLAAKAADKEVECSQSGFGVAPIIGIDYKFWRMNIGARYEFRTKITLENDTETDDTGMFPDGAETRSDIPALLAAGINYNFIDPLTLCIGGRYYFDKDAKLSNDAQEKIDDNTYEIAVGLEYKICDSWLVSASYLRTQYGLSDEYLTDLNFNMSNNNFGLGLRYTPCKLVSFDLGGFYTAYEDRTKKVALGTDTYSRTNFAFSLGANFKF